MEYPVSIRIFGKQQTHVFLGMFPPHPLHFLVSVGSYLDEYQVRAMPLVLNELGLGVNTQVLGSHHTHSGNPLFDVEHQLTYLRAVRHSR